MTSISLSFPQRVYNVLRFCEEQGREDIISWENNGAAFKVNNLQEFERNLLPKYFNTKKYYTFTRALYAHGYTCVRIGRQPGIYSHPSFHRDDPLSPSMIKRVSRKKATSNDHADSNPFLDALTSRASNRRHGVFSHQPTIKFPSLLGGDDDDVSTATVFGRPYHTIAAEDEGQTALLMPEVTPSPKTECLGLLNVGSDRINTRSFSNTIPLNSSPTSFQPSVATSNLKVNDLQFHGMPTSPNDSRFSSGSDFVRPMVSSSQIVLGVSDQGSHKSLIRRHDDFGGHSIHGDHKPPGQPSTNYASHEPYQRGATR